MDILTGAKVVVWLATLACHTATIIIESSNALELAKCQRMEVSSAFGLLLSR